jgi:DNA adenine methylase
MQVQSCGNDFVSFASGLFCQENNTEEAFYRLRSEFNTTTDLMRKSALFVYLNRHCFNGLCRYNSKGNFNVPFGRYSSPKFPADEILGFAEKSKTATFCHANFEATMASARLGDVVYCDPPYVPLNATSNFTDYTKDGFDLNAQKALARAAIELRSKGIPVVISNHDTEFTRTAYASANLDFFQVQRFISRDASNRGKASELLAVFA